MKRVYGPGEEVPSTLGVNVVPFGNGWRVCLFGVEPFLGREAILSIIRRALDERDFWDGVVGFC